MAARLICVLLGILMPLYSQGPTPVKAGDRAPNLTWTKIMASDSASAGPTGLSGQVTVLLFLRPISHNEEAVGRWNKLVEQFADRQVNFVWIANEKEETLAPFLKKQPVRGWLVLDPAEDSYKAYGVEGAAGVLIDAHGTIAGFTFVPPPEARQIEAVLDGRAIAIKGDATEAQMTALMQDKAVRLDAEPYHSPPPPEKPTLPASDEVHISVSKTEGTVGSVGPDHWMQRGFDLRAILSQVLDVEPTRIFLPAALDNGTRYDFVLVPPVEEDEQAMKRRVREGIENYFHVTIAPKIRPMDVYVMTVIEGKTPPRKPENEFSGGGVYASSRSFKLPEGTPQTAEAIDKALRDSTATLELTGATALSSTIDDFRRALEDGLHRPIVDETKLTGYYDFKLKREAETTEEFLGMLRDEIGIVLTPAQRSIEVIAVLQK